MTFEQHCVWFVVVISAIIIGAIAFVIFLSIRKRREKLDLCALKSVAEQAMANAKELEQIALGKANLAKKNSKLEVEAEVAQKMADEAMKKAMDIKKEYEELRCKCCPDEKIITKPQFAPTTLVINHSTEPTGYESPSHYAVAAYEQGFRSIHIDFMDGEFSEKSASGPQEIEQTIKAVKNASIDIHIMANDNEKWVKEISKVIKKCKAWHRCNIFFQIEPTPTELVKKIIKEYSCGIAIDLPTDITTVDKDILSSINCVLVMTVKAGLGGQKLDKNGLEKVKWLKANYPNIYVIVDGGINETTLDEVIASGADLLSLGMFGYKLIKENKVAQFLADIHKTTVYPTQSQ